MIQTRSVHLGADSAEGTADVGRAAAEALRDGVRPRPYVGVWAYGDADGVVDENAPLNPPSSTAWLMENEKRVLSPDPRGSADLSREYADRRSPGTNSPS
ncbi:hypothetical protein ACWCOW_02745 [Streptomyces sp. NPDC001939]|uniref:hypothetical protein n=1 Tax=unclassified Streptomyces TaxID=2593676 RepID=UPI00224C94B3|nr:hypothetical protein [Streptomyces sp. NBC_00401]MCX5079924.1 hypothetical protein [Streptomyces sp. NBC_00401]